MPEEFDGKRYWTTFESKPNKFFDEASSYLAKYGNPFCEEGEKPGPHCETEKDQMVKRTIDALFRTGE